MPPKRKHQPAENENEAKNEANNEANNEAKHEAKKKCTREQQEAASRTPGDGGPGQKTWLINACGVNNSRIEELHGMLIPKDRGHFAPLPKLTKLPKEAEDNKAWFDCHYQQQQTILDLQRLLSPEQLGWHLKSPQAVDPAMAIFTVPDEQFLKLARYHLEQLNHQQHIWVPQVPGEEDGFNTDLYLYWLWFLGAQSVLKAKNSTNPRWAAHNPDIAQQVCDDYFKRDGRFVRFNADITRLTLGRGDEFDIACVCIFHMIAAQHLVSRGAMGLYENLRDKIHLMTNALQKALVKALLCDQRNDLRTDLMCRIEMAFLSRKTTLPDKHKEGTHYCILRGDNAGLKEMMAKATADPKLKKAMKKQIGEANALAGFFEEKTGEYIDLFYVGCTGINLAPWDANPRPPPEEDPAPPPPVPAPIFCSSNGGCAGNSFSFAASGCSRSAVAAEPLAADPGKQTSSSYIKDFCEKAKEMQALWEKQCSTTRGSNSFDDDGDWFECEPVSEKPVSEKPVEEKPVSKESEEENEWGM